MIGTSISSDREIVRGQRQILRASLGINFQAALLRPTNLLHGLATRNVNNHDRHVDQFRSEDRSRSASDIAGKSRHKFSGRAAAPNESAPWPRDPKREQS